jgi:protein ImuA
VHDLPRCSTGFAALDAALGGGLARGAVHELLAEPGAAAHTLALRAAAGAAGANKWILYVDLPGEFYPPALVRLGVPLGRLIVVRAAQTADALWIAEQTLMCQALAAVVLPVRKLAAQASRRLQLAAESGGSLGLVVRDDDAHEPTFAATRLRLVPRAGPRGTLCVQVTVLKLREGRPGGEIVLELSDAPHSVHASAVSVDRAGSTRTRASG